VSFGDLPAALLCGGFWIVECLVGFGIATLLMTKKKKSRVRVLLIFAHASLFIGLFPYLVGYSLSLVQATHSPYGWYFQGLYILVTFFVMIPCHLVLFTATPLYIIALLFDYFDKYLNPRYRWAYWLCAFVPVFIFGFYVWLFCWSK
jgi:hypothetical protein